MIQNVLEPIAEVPKIAIAVPVMSKERFCYLSGIREPQFRSQSDRHNIATIKIGRLVGVNLVAETWDGIHGGWFVLNTCPYMTIDVFSGHTGWRVRQIQSQLEQKNLERKEIGRLVLVDNCALLRRCIDEAEEFRKAKVIAES